MEFIAYTPDFPPGYNYGARISVVDEKGHCYQKHFKNDEIAWRITQKVAFKVFPEHDIYNILMAQGLAQFPDWHCQVARTVWDKEKQKFTEWEPLTYIFEKLPEPEQGIVAWYVEDDEQIQAAQAIESAGTFGEEEEKGPETEGDKPESEGKKSESKGKKPDIGKASHFA